MPRTRFYLFFWIIILIPALVGCQKSDTEDYFLQHPDRIETVASQCDLEKTEPQQKKCQLATTLWQELQTYKFEAMLNPFSFGQKIMNAEIDLSRARGDLGKTKQQQKMQVERAEHQVKKLLIAIYLINQH